MSSASSFRDCFKPVSFSQLNGWQEDDHLAAFCCFKVSALAMIEAAPKTKSPLKTKSLGISTTDLLAVGKKAITCSIQTIAEARLFFENNFCLFQYSDPAESGFLTGYFEPEVAASRVKTTRFKYPIYQRPNDLVELDSNNRPATIDADYVFGRQTSNGIVEYFDRGEIQDGALDGQNLELFWLDDPVDLYHIHIQGSARLSFVDGSHTRISYAAKSGHPYTSIGSILVKSGEMSLKDITMQSIKAWLYQNSSRRSEILGKNRSFIFFRTADEWNNNSGPIGAAGVSLTSERSLAIDHKLYSFGLPFWVETFDNFVDSDHRLKKLLIAQDTGSAIVGTLRGDYFVGSGVEAGRIAGQIKHRATLRVLVPNPAQGL